MKRKKYTIKLTQEELQLIALHLNRGVYSDVAQLLSDLHAQVDTQLAPKAKMPTVNKQILTPDRKTNGSYAKAP